MTESLYVAGASMSRSTTSFSAAVFVGTWWLAVLACWNEPGGQPTMVMLTTAPSGWAQNGVTLPRAPVAQLADADGNPVRLAGTEVSMAITAEEGTLVGTTSVPTDTLGAATFDDVAIAGTVGPKTLTFSAAGLLEAKSTINLTAGLPASIAPVSNVSASPQ